jgi:hypothetical protein
MNEIQDAVDNQIDSSVLISKLNDETGKEYDVEYFESLHSHSDLNEAIEIACVSRPKYVPDLTRCELVDLVRRAIDAFDTDQFTKMDYYHELFDRNVAMLGASIVIHSYEVHWPDDECPDPQKIVEHVLAYKVILL